MPGNLIVLLLLFSLICYDLNPFLEWISMPAQTICNEVRQHFNDLGGEGDSVSICEVNSQCQLVLLVLQQPLCRAVFNIAHRGETEKQCCLLNTIVVQNLCML
jgi:hypothetical protein